jgi:hypothetical protein
MSTKIRHIEIPEHVRPLLGNLDSGTRMYHQLGSQKEFERWFDAVCEACAPDGALSPGAAGIYAQVSRAGVHKRMREGRLTAFLFRLARGGGPDNNKDQSGDAGRPYTFIPVRECRAWAKSLKARRRGESHPREHTGHDARIASPDRDAWRQW